MVCKEEVLNWYKLLSPSKRIEVMCGLLHMCIPLELRFLGSCLENLARKDFSMLREAELKANSPIEIGRVSDMQSEVSRARLVTYLALLHSTNHECANLVYNHILTCVEWSTRTLPMMDPDLAKELLLMMTMAANSPAFTFDQRQIICDHIVTLKNLFYNYIYQEECSEQCVHNQRQTSDSRPDGGNTEAVYIQGIKMVGHQKRPEDGLCEYHLKVTWSNDRVTTVSRTFAELHNFHVQLVKLFPNEAGAHKQERKIPYLHSGKCGGSPSDHDSEQNVTYVEEYTQALSSMPEHLIQCGHVTNFFGPPPTEDLSGFQDYSDLAGEHYGSAPPVVPLQYYNSLVIPVLHGGFVGSHPPHMAATNIVNAVTTNHKLAYTHKLAVEPTSQCSSLPSPLSSPQETPSPPSISDSGQQVRDWLTSVHLSKYSPHLTKFSMQELLTLSEDRLESMGLPKGATRKLIKGLETLKSKRNVNGLVGIPAESQSRPESPLTPPTTYHTPPSQSGTSRAESENGSSDCGLTASSSSENGEDIPGKPPPAIRHIPVPQKSASLPSMLSHDDGRLCISNSQQELRGDMVHVHMHRPPAPPSPSVMGPRFPVRSPLRPSKPLVLQVAPPMQDPAIVRHAAEFTTNIVLGAPRDADRPPETITPVSVSVVTTSHMFSPTQVTVSNYKPAVVMPRPSSPPPPHQSYQQMPQLVPMPHHFSYPPPPMSADPGSVMPPAPTIQHAEHGIAHGYPVGNSSNQTGYNSDSGLHSASTHYTGGVPHNSSVPASLGASQVTTATVVTYASGGHPFVAPPSAAPSYHQFTLPHGVPPPLMARHHCHGCSGSCPGSQHQPYISGQVVHYPAFIPTSNGLISPGMPNINPGHVATVNGMVSHMRGVPLHPFFRPPPPKGRILECFNCGQTGHHGSECKEQTMDKVTYGGMYHMKFAEEEEK